MYQFDYAEYFDNVCNLPHTQLTPNELLVYLKFHGFTSAEVEQFLQEGVDPLDWFRSERLLSGDNSDMMSLTSDTKKIKQTFTEAKSIQSELELDLPTGVPFQACVYLAGDELGTKTPIVFDTGCSFSLAPCITDFVSDLEPADADRMTGINTSVAIEGVGWVEWIMRDVFGNTCLI